MSTSKGVRYRNLRYTDFFHTQHYHVHRNRDGRVIGYIYRLREPRVTVHGRYDWVGRWNGKNMHLKRRGDIEEWLRKDGLLE